MDEDTANEALRHFVMFAHDSHERYEFESRSKEISAERVAYYQYKTADGLFIT